MNTIHLNRIFDITTFLLLLLLLQWSVSQSGDRLPHCPQLAYFKNIYAENLT